MSPPKEQLQMVEKARRAGWTIKPLKNGWRCLAPDGVGVVHLHTNGKQSDGNAWKNVRRDFLRCGLDVDAL